MSIIKPQSPIINWGNPLTQGLITAIPLFENGGSSARDLYKRYIGTLVNTPLWKPSVVGPSVNFTTASSQKISLAAVPVGNRTAWTIAVWFFSTATTNGRIYSEGNTGNDNPFISLSFNENIAGDMEFQMQNDDATASTFIATGDISLNNGNPHMATFVQSSKTLREAFMDNKSYGTSNSNINTITTNVANIAAFQRIATTGYLTGNVIQLLIWNRAITKTEIKQLYSNPWQIYKQPKIPFWMAAPATVVAAATARLRALLGVGL